MKIYDCASFIKTRYSNDVKLDIQMMYKLIRSCLRKQIGDSMNNSLAHDFLK